MTTLTLAETGYTYKVNADIVVQTCCSCHMLFGVDGDFDKRRRNDHNWFYCPNGHPQHYSGKTETASVPI